MYQYAVQHLALLHNQSKELVERIALSIVESGYEPELFKSAFVDGGWSNFEHTALSQISKNDLNEDSDGEETKTSTVTKTTTVADLLPENVWIN